MGATAFLRAVERMNSVSIHAPVMDANQRIAGCLVLSNRFNPRARDGRDGRFRIEGQERIHVSIHAPVMGATGNVAVYKQPTGTFQSTRP